MCGFCRIFRLKSAFEKQHKYIDLFAFNKEQLKIDIDRYLLGLSSIK